MTDKIDKANVMTQAFKTALRIVREGGIAQVQIPAHDTDELATVEINHARACDLMCGYLAGLSSELWQQIRDGQSLSSGEREGLKLWTDVTLVDLEDAERTSSATSNECRARFYLIKGDRP